MNERLKELAAQAGLQPYYDREFIRFAELVRQDERNKKWTQKQWTDYELAIAADEREACALLCEKNMFFATGEQHAKAIRARGNT